MMDACNIEWRSLHWLLGYEISENGDVRRTHATDGSPAGTILAGSLCNGYRRHNLKFEGKFRTFRTHRLVCEAWYGPPPSEEAHAAHNDGDRQNNHFSNLRWATALENARDRIKHGTNCAGQSNPAAKLTPAEVQAIRNAFTGQRGQPTKLSRAFNVSKTTIRNIVKSKNWREMPSDVA